MPNYSRDTHKAYPEISINRHPSLPRADWVARVYSYQPLGYRWQGRDYPEWPSGLPAPVYPEFPHNGTREQIAEWRKKCSEINNSNPVPLTLIEEITGFADGENQESAYENALQAATDAIDRVMQWQSI